MVHHKLTVDNWNQPDALSERCFLTGPDGAPIEMNGDAWARQFINVEMHQSVPTEVRDLFAVAQATLIYGWFFYPLYEVGEKQLSRVCEAAAFHRYRASGGPEEEPAFFESLRWLAARDIITDGDGVWWDAARRLRNIGAHAKHRSVIPPGHALRVLTTVSKAVNKLFVDAS